MLLIAAIAMLFGLPAFLLSLWVWIREKQFEPTLFYGGLVLIAVGVFSIA